jgi:ribosome assembly protein RRB1
MLQYDPTVYDCMSSMSLDWPCLSFDVLRDHLGAPRAAFPHTLFMVAGTQVRGAGGRGLAGQLEAVGQARAWSPC